MRSGTPTLRPEGLAARVVLAMVATAGILYANIGPVIVSGLASTARFTSETAGYVFSLDLYGAMIGGLCVILLVERLRWRRAGALLLALVLVADLASVWIDDAYALYAVRSAHGFVSGAFLGLASSVIARTQSPERTFAFYIVIQLMLGGVGTAVLTPLITTIGIGVVWLALAGFTLLALLLLPMLDDYPLQPRGATASRSIARAPLPALCMALAAVFLYQAGEMAAFAYMIELGRHRLFDADFIGLAVAASLWIGGPAALLVAWWSTRNGRLLPVSAGIVLLAAALALLLIADATAYFVANAVGFGIFFSMTFPYLLGVASEMDNTGRFAAVAGCVSGAGLATGPAVAGALSANGHFDAVVLFSVSSLLASAVLVAHPARVLDRLNPHGRVVW